jgi:aerobic carbon-monoxide dehydrogenase large subunit
VKVQWGHGTYGSRSLVVGGSAIMKACDKVIDKATKVAAHLMEAAPADIKFEAGTFTVKGTDKTKSIGEVIMAAYVPHNFPLQEMEPGLDARAFYDPANFTFPFGCHICEVEVDPETGVTTIVNWVAVDDFGTLINPMIVEGQVHGGIAHGVGQALLERALYDPDSGQLLTGSYNDYTMPRAGDLPSFTLGFKHTPSPHNPLGAKGCGEAGAIAAPAAVINALTDALGVRDLAMPATSQTVWQALQAAPSPGKRPNRDNGRRTAMQDFNYHRPTSLDDAVKLLKDSPDAKLLSGGMTIIPTMKQRLASPSDVIDLTGLGLSGITVEGDT